MLIDLQQQGHQQQQRSNNSWEPKNANGSITSLTAESPAKQRQQQAANVSRAASNSRDISSSRETNNSRSQATAPDRRPQISPFFKIELRRKMYVE
jgi:transcription initiation factor TFIID subunit TAF12